MVTTFSLLLQTDRIAASIRPVMGAKAAQETAIVAQEQAAEAQHEAVKALAVESGEEVPLTADDRLKAASEAVKKADDKLIEHALK